ncbi:hypothetical protein CAEBREN_07071 [Caenorhabditis brenneri]|uniref:Uncharacterized protein n=1 Tax=Caenorhabditis brenneri TaxID=135651 RepID=G0M9N9_CAEBE|nr:hypothetical protein CAEBREN_07071 [Caenorhabditis brenneri]
MYFMDVSDPNIYDPDIVEKVEPQTMACPPAGCSDKPELKEIQLDYFSWPLIFQNLVCLGSFFIMLLVLASSVIIRTSVSFLTTLIAANTNDQTILYATVTDIALYADYCTNYFSMILIFFMALNRCLSFVNSDWNETIFDGKRVFIPVIISILLGVISSIVIIITSDIKRRYATFMGFIDYGYKEGWKKVINRTFHIFPIGAVICYLILFSHIRQRNQVVTTVPKNQADRKVFTQLLVTVVFYGIMSTIVEIMEFIRLDSTQNLQATLIAILNVFNYLPELSLPFLLVVNNLKQLKNNSIFISPLGPKTNNVVTTVGGKGEEPSFNQPALVDLKKTVACIGNITCKGSKKLVKFHFDTLVFSMEQLEGDKIQCVRKTGQATQLRQCILDIWPFLHAKQYNGEIITCTHDLLKDLECGSEEKKTIMRAAWAQDYNMRTKIATWKGIDGVDNFDLVFDSGDFY